MATQRIYLSAPHAADDERALVQAALDSNWLAPVGPDLDAFETELAARVGVPHAVALSSGTAALHLGLEGVGVDDGDRVVLPTLTFAATTNAVIYLGGRPTFIDVDRDTWTMSPHLLEEELERATRTNQRPRAVLAVDLYGQCADYDAIGGVCARYDVPLVEDAAEALGADYRGRPAGSFGACAAFSFNGNKIITTSGGGMLVSHDRALIERARYLATQARDDTPHYQHAEVGYNYRLSNVLAALGRGQLRGLDTRLAARRENARFYRQTLGHAPGLSFMPEASYGRGNCWLTCLLIDPVVFGATREEVRLHLNAHDIESRPVWKPMHLQPAYDRYDVRGGAVAEQLFETGLCLPSGSNLTAADLTRVAECVLSTPSSSTGRPAPEGVSAAPV